MDLLKSIVDWFIPPVSHDEHVQYMWRLRIALFGCTSFLGVIVLFAYLLGFIPTMQAPILAADLQPLHEQIKQTQVQIASVQQQASMNVDALRQDINADRTERIEGELLQLRVKHCTAKGAARDLYWTRISSLLVKYQRLTGRTFPLANCTDL